MDQLIQAIPLFLDGAVVTLELTVVAIFIGLILGLFLAIGRLSSNAVIKSLVGFYIWFFRGTPLLLQIWFIYFGFPTLCPALNVNIFVSGFVALGLNSAAYLAEIIRAAIQSIDKGQMEASKALGMGYGQAMRRIIIPQSYRRLIPPVGNEFIALLKDSSLVSVIGLTEIMRVATNQASTVGNPVLFVPAAVFYLAMTSIFTYVFSKLEKKYSVYE